MPAQTILYKMPNGRVGQVSRFGNASVIEAAFLANDTLCGLFVAVDTASRKLIPATTAASVYGILTNSYPTMTAMDAQYPNYDTVGLDQPVTMMAGKSVGVLRTGYILVKYAGTNPCQKGQQVYMVTATGAIADNATAGTVAIPNCTFNGEALPNTVVEIIYNI